MRYYSLPISRSGLYNVYLPVGAGLEVAVPATKTFTGTLSILLQLAGYAGDKFNGLEMESMIYTMY